MEQEESQANANGVRAIVRGEDGWPSPLASVEHPPHTLWLRGHADLLGPCRRIAIVGSRAPTPYGVAQAQRFGAELARAGIVVVSGLARGIDATAHCAALDAGGTTIAVLGSGVDRPWPAGALANRIAGEGLLISEWAPGVGPRRHHFPARNRIIAGLSDAVLVIEAAEASGSLITARWAADQGQSVFALPGRVDHPMALGTLGLLREGATPVGSPATLHADVYGEDLSAADGALPFTPALGSGARARSAPPGASDPLLAALQGETLGAEDLSRSVRVPLGEALSRLAVLELDGRVQRVPGGLYRLT